MKRLYRFTIPLIIAIVLVCTSNTQWSKNNWANIIKADGKGYYAYLPATFIYNDLHFNFFDTIEKKYPNSQIFYDYRIIFKNKVVNKYPAGTAVAILPFFLIAHTASFITGGPCDGYSKAYLISIYLAAIFYLAIGLIFLRKFLKLYNASEKTISFLLIAITFGTNLFYYVMCEPDMSHIYSFAFITIFLYWLKKYFILPDSTVLCFLAALLGFIMLIRPVNGIIILFVPFVAGDKAALFSGFSFMKRNIKSLVVALLLFVSVIFVQLLIYKAQTGLFFVDSYPGENFNWFANNIFNFMFSYKKGFFVYTPLALLIIIGFYALYKNSYYLFICLLGFFIVLFYVLSSWWNWWYGGSFGTRVLIDFYAIVALVMFLGYDYLKIKAYKKMYLVFVMAAIVLCQIQTYQYRYSFIHWEKMDKEHYWNVFLRLDLMSKNENPNIDLLLK